MNENKTDRIDENIYLSYSDQYRYKYDVPVHGSINLML